MSIVSSAHSWVEELDNMDLPIVPESSPESIDLDPFASHPFDGRLWLPSNDPYVRAERQLTIGPFLTRLWSLQHEIHLATVSLENEDFEGLRRRLDEVHEKALELIEDIRQYYLERTRHDLAVNWILGVLRLVWWYVVAPRNKMMYEPDTARQRILAGQTVVDNNHRDQVIRGFERRARRDGLFNLPANQNAVAMAEVPVNENNPTNAEASGDGEDLQECADDEYDMSEEADMVEEAQEEDAEQSIATDWIKRRDEPLAMFPCTPSAPRFMKEIPTTDLAKTVEAIAQLPMQFPFSPPSSQQSPTKQIHVATPQQNILDQKAEALERRERKLQRMERRVRKRELKLQEREQTIRDHDLTIQENHQRLLLADQKFVEDQQRQIREMENAVYQDERRRLQLMDKQKGLLQLEQRRLKSQGGKWLSLDYVKKGILWGKHTSEKGHNILFQEMRDIERELLGEEKWGESTQRKKQRLPQPRMYPVV